MPTNETSFSAALFGHAHHRNFITMHKLRLQYKLILTIIVVCHSGKKDIHQSSNLNQSQFTVALRDKEKSKCVPPEFHSSKYCFISGLVHPPNGLKPLNDGRVSLCTYLPFVVTLSQILIVFLELDVPEWVTSTYTTLSHDLFPCQLSGVHSRRFILLQIW